MSTVIALSVMLLAVAGLSAMVVFDLRIHSSVHVLDTDSLVDSVGCIDFSEVNVAVISVPEPQSPDKEPKVPMAIILRGNHHLS